jgi:hypothetical protein
VTDAPGFPPVDAKLLNEVVARIRRVGDPQRVVLFGSYASGCFISTILREGVTLYER